MDSALVFIRKIAVVVQVASLPAAKCHLGKVRKPSLHELAVQTHHSLLQETMVPIYSSIDASSIAGQHRRARFASSHLIAKNTPPGAHSQALRTFQYKQHRQPLSMAGPLCCSFKLMETCLWEGLLQNWRPSCFQAYSGDQRMKED